MIAAEKSVSHSNGRHCCSHTLQWVYLLVLTGLTLYQFVELHYIKDEVALLKQVKAYAFQSSLKLILLLISIFVRLKSDISTNIVLWDLSDKISFLRKTTDV